MPGGGVQYGGRWEQRIGGHPFSFSRPETEAKDLLRAVQTGCLSVEEARKTILISEREARLIERNFSASCATAELCTEFRTSVLREFDKLIEKGFLTRPPVLKLTRDQRAQRRKEVRAIRNRRKRGESFATIAKALRLSERTVSSRVADARLFDEVEA